MAARKSDPQATAPQATAPQDATPEDATPQDAAPQDAAPQDASEPAGTPEPLNRAERRAQQRGKKASSATPPTVRDGARGHHDQVLGQQRRAGRRGNR